MEIEHDFNFNTVLELIEVFRIKEEDKYEEFNGKFCIGWEDVKLIQQYPYPDNWELGRGEKYYLCLHNNSERKLVLGSYESMKHYWDMFRNRYPLFSQLDFDEDNE